MASLVAYLRTTLRLPARSIQRALAHLHGLRLSVGAVADLLRRIAQCGADAVTAIRDRARSRTVVHVDETGRREARQNGYAWLLATPQGERYVEYHHSRAGAVAQGLLGEDFYGVLVSDFYGGYNNTPGGRHQRCWVHLLRDARTLRDTHAADLSFPGVETHAWADALLRLGQRRHPERHPAADLGPALAGRTPRPRLPVLLHPGAPLSGAGLAAAAFWRGVADLRRPIRSSARQQFRRTRHPPTGRRPHDQWRHA
ncbi:MAG: transposase [Ktedonobacterales bacterium]